MTRLNWYRIRQVPDFVSTSIEVFDAQGGSHVLEARFSVLAPRLRPALVLALTPGI